MPRLGYPTREQRAKAQTLEHSNTFFKMLKSLVEEFIQSGNDRPLLDYLSSNSNLPGPRGNLELAFSFADHLAEQESSNLDVLWNLCQRMTSVSPEKAPVNSPGEFIPFCGAVGMGSIGAANSAFFGRAVSRLRELSSDARWRMREAVVMGMQRLTAANPDVVLNELRRWIDGGKLLELRAAAATVAEPALLKHNRITQAALQLNKDVVKKLREVRDRKSENFRALRKALGYTLSVVILPAPEQGFGYLRQLAQIDDRDIQWIVKENLKKNRLIRNYPAEVESMRSLLT